MLQITAILSAPSNATVTVDYNLKRGTATPDSEYSPGWIVMTVAGDDSGSPWRDTRKLSREHFTPGKFVAPHGACFDHKGNIFVVEWVEVGRVTKLRKV